LAGHKWRELQIQKYDRIGLPGIRI
jgi:hypothetical protein